MPILSGSGALEMLLGKQLKSMCSLYKTGHGTQWYRVIDDHAFP